MNKKKLVGLLLKTLVIFMVISFLYLLIIRRPHPAETIVRNFLIARQTPLIENRLAIMQIASLDPNSSRYYDDLSQVYYLVEKSSENGNKLISEALPKQVSEELARDFPQMKADYKLVLEAQIKFIEKQKENDPKLTKVFEYSPSLDLSGIDANTSAERINAAIEGLDKAKVAYTEGSKLIDDVQLAFTKYKTNKNLDALDKAYKDFKIELYKLKIKALTEKEELEILAKQTTLINKFEYFIDSLKR